MQSPFGGSTTIRETESVVPSKLAMSLAALSLETSVTSPLKETGIRTFFRLLGCSLTTMSRLDIDNDDPQSLLSVSTCQAIAKTFSSVCYKERKLVGQYGIVTNNTLCLTA